MNSRMLNGIQKSLGIQPSNPFDKYASDNVVQQVSNQGVGDNKANTSTDGMEDRNQAYGKAGKTGNVGDDTDYGAQQPPAEGTGEVNNTHDGSHATVEGSGIPDKSLEKTAGAYRKRLRKTLVG